MTAVSVVTGASRGIGRAVALSLAARGRQVLATGRDTEALAELERTSGGNVNVFAADLAGQAGVAALCEAAFALGDVRELVCAAGISRHAPLGAIEPSVLEQQLNVNLCMPLLLAQTFGVSMSAGGQGAVVFVASTLASKPAPATIAYAASKAGLLAAMRGMALELAPYGVRVNAVSPGVVDTAMVRAPRGDGLSAEERLESLRVLHPLGRLGNVEDVAAAVLYLLDAPWVTGSELSVDGGLRLA